MQLQSQLEVSSGCLRVPKFLPLIWALTLFFLVCVWSEIVALIWHIVDSRYTRIPEEESILRRMVWILESRMKVMLFLSGTTHRDDMPAVGVSIVTIVRVPCS